MSFSDSKRYSVILYSIERDNIVLSFPTLYEAIRARDFLLSSRYSGDLAMSGEISIVPPSIFTYWGFSYIYNRKRVLVRFTRDECFDESTGKLKLLPGLSCYSFRLTIRLGKTQSWLGDFDIFLEKELEPALDSMIFTKIGRSLGTMYIKKFEN